MPASKAHVTYPNPLAVAFEGAIIVRLVDHPTRAFVYEVTFHTQHPRLLALDGHKPPLHFHPYQHEYFRVLSGVLNVEIEGVTTELRPEDGEAVAKPWQHHRLYPYSDPSSPKEQTKTVFLLSADDTQEALRLDTVFFENWYAYQDEIFLRRGGRPDLVQVMNIFDAGGSYLSLPQWIPFNRTISRGFGIVVGRWMGGLLGYQPFRRTWTTDWELACEKMEQTWPLAKFAVRDHAKTL